MKFVLGLTGRAGVVTGNTGPFFFSQEFALGGVQYGEQLRGYEEFLHLAFRVHHEHGQLQRDAPVVRQGVLHRDGGAWLPREPVAVREPVLRRG
jgi:hypothetical protein